MTADDITIIKFFRWGKDDEEDTELQILKVEKIDYERGSLSACRYREYEPEELTFSFSQFSDVEMDLLDSKPFEEEERRQEDSLREWQRKYIEELTRKNEVKSAHFKEMNSSFERGQEIESLSGYPKKASDFSTEDDRYFLNDLRIEDGELVYSLMIVETRKHRGVYLYEFFI